MKQSKSPAERAKKKRVRVSVAQKAAAPEKTAAPQRSKKAKAPKAAESGISSRQENFCQNYAKGMPANAAYSAAYGNTRSAEAAASRLLTTVKVKARIAALREEAARGAVYSLQQTLEYLTSGIVTPLGDVDERSKLCQAAEYLVQGGVRGKLRRGEAESGNEEEEPETTTVKIKMVDKLRAVELLAKLQGWMTEKHEHKHGADDGLLGLLGAIRAGQ